MAKNLGEVKKIIKNRVKATYNETEAFVSIFNLKNISVMVAGEVFYPGVYQMSSLSSVIKAIRLAGGIKKTGSLRRIKISSNYGNREVDLYSYLFELDSNQRNFFFFLK